MTCYIKDTMSTRPLAGLVDLHIHSTCSDGTLAPEALVKEAATLGLRAIALADHDNIDGIAAATAAGATMGVEVIPGVELSVVWEKLNDLHLLGYGFDPGHPALGSSLAEFRAFRANRNRMILERINVRLVEERRTPLPFAEIAARAGGTLGRPHIGQALLAAGYARTMEDAFQRYLVPFNVSKRFFPIAEAIDMIHAAGGCAVLAHPMYIPIDDRQLPALLDTFMPLGLDGMECWCGGADNATVDRLLTLARRKGLIATGGSDFHQPGPSPMLGRGLGNLKIPYACVEELRERATRYP